MRAGKWVWSQQNVQANGFGASKTAKTLLDEDAEEVTEAAINCLAARVCHSRGGRPELTLLQPATPNSHTIVRAQVGGARAGNRGNILPPPQPLGRDHCPPVRGGQPRARLGPNSHSRGEKVSKARSGSGLTARSGGARGECPCRTEASFAPPAPPHPALCVVTAAIDTNSHAPAQQPTCSLQPRDSPLCSVRHRSHSLVRHRISHTLCKNIA